MSTFNIIFQTTIDGEANQEILSVDGCTTIGDLSKDTDMADLDNLEYYLNGRLVDPDDNPTLRVGDTLKICGNTPRSEAADEGENVSILFLNAATEQFGQRLSIPAGTTVRDFLDQQGVDLRGKSVTLEGQPIERERTLNEGDRLVVTSVMVKGASDTATVKLFDCTKEIHVPVIKTIIPGVLLSSFLETHIDHDLRETSIRVSGQPVASDHCLNGGEVISVTPIGLKGAR